MQHFFDVYLKIKCWLELRSVEMSLQGLTLAYICVHGLELAMMSLHELI